VSPDLITTIALLVLALLVCMVGAALHGDRK
jgi:hypothetical protein